MKPLPLPPRLVGLAVGAVLALAGCSAPYVSTQAPTPVRQPSAPIAEPASVASAPFAKPPTDWQLLDEGADHVAGISLVRADTELLSGLQPRQTVLVAVIDGGLDTADVDLLPHLWRNPGEIAANGKDDDRNGHVDDTWGWNFIGGADGKDLDHETLEITRLYTRCKHLTPQLSVAPPGPSAADCARIETDFPIKRDSAVQLLDRINNAANALDRASQILSLAIPESLTVARVKAYQPTGGLQSQARAIYLQLEEANITKQVIADAKKDQESQVNFGYDTTYFPRPSIVGDNLMDLSQRDYGNRDVTGPDALHGSHVSGIIGAVPDAKEGIRGIAQSVRIMMVRTIPDGDERDKDVANAIRYAVDNGAKVINMSFGKPYSPQKADVDAAVKYADAHGVLMIHAAGNDNQDTDQGHNFPTPYYLDGGKARNWIEVGASSWKGGDSLAAPFSNYGQTRVDVFAPGVDIKSTVEHNEFKRESGTSMASPVVAGLAALIMSYYPNFTAAQVKQIILASAIRYPKQMVVRPGAGDGDPLVPFGTLSVTGGIVNAYAALQLAAKEAGGHTP
ncbi:MAG: S8 family peptidase [Gemmatimonadota bacterium]|nr:S8 family peptidase [Gemmatimonadota bacterium]